MPDFLLDIPATVAALNTGRPHPYGRDEQRRKFTGRVPYFAIRQIVGAFHVGTSHETIAADIYRRARHTNATRAELLECIRFALAVHTRNAAIYCYVTRGFSRTRKAS